MRLQTDALVLLKTKKRAGGNRKEGIVRRETRGGGREKELREAIQLAAAGLLRSVPAGSTQVDAAMAQEPLEHGVVAPFIKVDDHRFNGLGKGGSQVRLLGPRGHHQGSCFWGYHRRSRHRQDQAGCPLGA